jgi:hypothetical protein
MNTYANNGYCFMTGGNVGIPNRRSMIGIALSIENSLRTSSGPPAGCAKIFCDCGRCHKNIS